MGAILHIESLTKEYGQQTALDDLNLELGPGRILGLLGPNGSGKSTTLHCVTGITMPTRGRILINGYEHDSKAAKMSFGFMPDDLSMPENLTGAEYLDLIRRVQPASDRDRIREMIEAMNLGAAMGKMISQYSHGMKRKIQIIASLAHNPSLIIMDEPFRGLDPEAYQLLRAVMREFVDHGGAVLTSTHDLVSAESYCDDVHILADGRTVDSGTPSELVVRYERDDLAGVFMSATGLEQRTEQQLQRLTARLFDGPLTASPTGPDADTDLQE